MKSLLLALSLLLCPFAASYAAPAAAGKDVRVRWRSENYELRYLPDELPPAARASIEAWGPWCKDEGYRMDLSEDARVLLITPESNRARGRQMKLVERVMSMFDRDFPPGAPAPQVADAAADKAVPENPLPDGPLPELAGRVLLSMGLGREDAGG